MSTLDDVETWLAEQLPALIEKYGVPAAAVAVLHWTARWSTAPPGALHLGTGVEATAGLAVPDRLDHQAVDRDAGDAAGRRGPGRPRRPGAHLPAGVPDRPTRTPPRAITVRQLLTHTAGFEGDIFTDTGVGDDCVEKYVDVLARRTAAVPAGGAVLLQQRRLLRARPAGRGAAREAVRRVPARAPVPARSASPTPRPAAPTRRSCTASRWATSSPEPGRGQRRPGLGAGPLQRAGRLHARDARRATCSPSPRCTWPTARAADGTQVLAPGTAGRMQARQVELPDLGRDGRLVGPRAASCFDTADGAIIGHDGNTIGQAPSCGSSPSTGSPSRCSPTAATRSRSTTTSSATCLRELAGVALPAPAGAAGRPRSGSTRAASSAPTPPRSPTWSSARTTTAGSGSSRSPKGVAELGEQPERSELVHFARDTLIPLEPRARHAHPARVPGRRRRRPRPVPAHRPRRPARRGLRARESPREQGTAHEAEGNPGRLRHHSPSSPAAAAGERRQLRRGGGDTTYVDGGTFTMALAARPGQPRPAVRRRPPRCSREPARLRHAGLHRRRHRRDPVRSSPRTGRSTARPSRSRWPTASPAPTARASRPSTVADNINYVADPKNKSPFLGTFLPAGATATGRRRGRHRHDHARPARAVRAATASPACRSSARTGMKDRKSLAGEDRRHRPLRADRGGPGRPLHLPDP